MKIAVVNYDELYSCPNEGEVIRDIISIFDGVSDKCKNDFGNTLRTQIKELLVPSIKHDVYYADTTSQYVRKRIISCLFDFSPDILITYNMAGFENKTLTGLVAYNIVDCRQFHIVTHDYDIITDSSELKSLNMFFFKKDDQRFIELNENTDI